MNSVIEHLLTNISWYLLGIMSSTIYLIVMQLYAMRRATRAMIKRDIVGLYEKCKEKGCTNIYEHDTMDDLYVQYQRLKGNGSIARVYELYNQLEICSLSNSYIHEKPPER